MVGKTNLVPGRHINILLIKNRQRRTTPATGMAINVWKPRKMKKLYCDYNSKVVPKCHPILGSSFASICLPQIQYLKS